MQQAQNIARAFLSSSRTVRDSGMAAMAAPRVMRLDDCANIVGKLISHIEPRGLGGRVWWGEKGNGGSNQREGGLAASTVALRPRHWQFSGRCKALYFVHAAAA